MARYYSFRTHGRFLIIKVACSRRSSLGSTTYRHACATRGYMHGCTQATALAVVELRRVAEECYKAAASWSVSSNDPLRKICFMTVAPPKT